MQIASSRFVRQLQTIVADCIDLKKRFIFFEQIYYIEPRELSILLVQALVYLPGEIEIFRIIDGKAVRRQVARVLYISRAEQLRLVIDERRHVLAQLRVICKPVQAP